MDPIKCRHYADLLSIFMIGFLICLFVQFKIQDNFEKNVFENISATVLGKRQTFNEDSSIIDALHITYKLLSARTVVFGGNSPLNSGFYDGSLTDDLMTAKGACGSYASVLANLLASMGYKTRIAQMKVNENYGGHIITEVNTQKGWVVLDASYDLFFITPSGGLASFGDVSANWEYYKGQTPVSYDRAYRYAGVRYANWDKIPVLLPAVKNILGLLLGEQKMRTFSIRPFFLRKYKVYSVLLLPLILLLAARLLKNKPILKPITMTNLLSRTGLSNLFGHVSVHSRSRRNYYLSFVNELDLQGLLDYQDSSGSDIQETAAEISFFNLPFNSVFSKLKAKLGLPRYHISYQHRDKRHEIYFYKIVLFNKNAIVQFHYFDRLYFLCNITFADTKDGQRRNILAALAEKYSIKTSSDCANISVDPQRNLLMFDNSVNLNICYTNNNREIIRLSMENPTTRRNEAADYDRSIHNLLEIL